MRFGRFWAASVLVLLRLIVGLGHEIRGLDRIPRGGCIIAMKHQSAWDALILPVDARRLRGRGEARTAAAAVLRLVCGTRRLDRDRPQGRGGRAAPDVGQRPAPPAAAGRPIVIFPEGTRVAPGERRPYQPGVAALYQALALPLVPAAVNSGLFWGRRASSKRPGRIVLEFLDPIPPGRTRPPRDGRTRTADRDRHRRAAARGREKINARAESRANSTRAPE